MFFFFFFFGLCSLTFRTKITSSHKLIRDFSISLIALRVFPSMNNTCVEEYCIHQRSDSGQLTSLFERIDRCYCSFLFIQWGGSN
ncbi:uncharacterized protein K444DRAFT_273072 [Hyaloscypha bicolor E]|uniref:Secreted protein n=1 Tax=Hyaloscypha bicolor E TaxID=1095630 RepID=A0A2J6SIK6_9HELO|nr:uncharacterized protein K444DRAFT_273072 [Hyaloscypha bicolor E]PMD50604.1 hypothetical protein K444DRAFT_273072 [Hyaloscypha bicolor E]